MKLQQQSGGLHFAELRDTAEMISTDLLDAVDVGVVQLDTHGKVVQLNTAARKILGAPRETLLGASACTLFCESTPEECPIRKALTTGVSQKDVAVVLSHDGQPIHVEYTCKTLRKCDQVIGAVLTVADVSEHYATEEALRHFKRAVEQSPSTIVITDVHGRIEYANPKLTELSGYAFEEVRGKTPSIFKSGETPREEYTKLWQTISAGEEWRGEFHNRKKNGELYWEAASISPLRNAQGVITHYLAIKEDTTALHELQEQQRVFVHTVSHDLRNPLAVIVGHARLALEALDDEPRDEQSERFSIQAIMRSAERMNLMIQDLTDAARLEGGQLQMKHQTVHFAGYLRELLQRTSATMDTARIRVEIPTDLSPVLADSDRLERVITNLLSNALKYSQPETPIIVQAHQQGPCVHITVRDFGRGIAPEDLPHLFERFYRAHGARKTEGIGLGLYITRMLVEAMGGCVDVESTLGEGSTFVVTLPVAA